MLPLLAINQLLPLLKQLWWVIATVLLILIGIIVYIANPMNLFRQEGLILYDTPIMVEKVKDIGILVTDEYYGEVITSLEETYEYSEATYDSLKSFYDAKYGRKDTHINNMDTILTRLVINNFQSKKWEELLLKTSWKGFNKLSNTQKVTGKKKELILIGRGWVKTGIDLSAIEADDLRLQNDTLTVQVPAPTILYTDINPWFSVENQIKGFEIFKEKRDATLFNIEVKAVKHYAKIKLLQQALDHGIIEQSKEDSKKNLSSFFRLLGFQHVIIQYDDEVKKNLPLPKFSKQLTHL